MKKYIGKKEIQAELMNECEAVELGYARPNEDNHEWREGYHVVYEDGYHSWSPKDVFEKAYKPSETHIDRMKIESDELVERCAKLEAFLRSDKIKDLSNEEMRFLVAQLGIMCAYENILEVRLDKAKDQE